jgi:hypothetical protein
MYHVEKILDKRTIENGTFEYKVKWKGYPMSQCTWEPYSNLKNISEMLDEFNSKEASEKPIDLLGEKRKRGRRKKNASEISQKINPLKKSAKNCFEDSPIEILDGSTDENYAKPCSEDSEKSEDLQKIFNQDLGSKQFVEITNEIEPPKLLSYDFPEKVISFKKKESGELIFLCEWKPRKDGTKISNCYITNEALKTFFPKVLFKFYESKILSEA